MLVIEAIQDNNSKAFEASDGVTYKCKHNILYFFDYFRKEWLEVNSMTPKFLHIECSYVEDPSLVDFATAWEAAKNGKTIVLEKFPNIKYKMEDGALMTSNGCLTLVCETNIDGKWRILQ